MKFYTVFFLGSNKFLPYNFNIKNFTVIFLNQFLYILNRNCQKNFIFEVSFFLKTKLNILCFSSNTQNICAFCSVIYYGRPLRKSPSLPGRKSTPTPKFLGTAKAYFVCHIRPNFQISLIYAFIGCP